MYRLLLMPMIAAILVDSSLANYTLHPTAVLFQLTLESQIDTAIEKFETDVEDQEISSVAIGEIKDNTTGNTGPGIRLLISKSLERKNITVDESSELQITGEISIANNALPNGDNVKEAVVKLKLVLNDETINNHTVKIDNPAKIAELAGFSMPLNPSDPTDRNVQNELDKQEKILKLSETERDKDRYWTFNEEDNSIQVNNDSEISAQILVGSAALQYPQMKVCKPVATSPFPYVPIGIGQAYAVKITNNSPDQIGVIMKIDGIDRFQFSDDRDEKNNPRFRYTVIPAGKSGVISGWHITSDPSRVDNLKRFSVTKYGDTAQAQLGNQDRTKLGVITLAFCRQIPQPNIALQPMRTSNPPTQQSQNTREVISSNSSSSRHGGAKSMSSGSSGQGGAKSMSSGSSRQGGAKSMRIMGSDGSTSTSSSVSADESDEPIGTGFGQQLRAKQPPVVALFEEPFEILSIRYANRR